MPQSAEEREADRTQHMRLGIILDQLAKAVDVLAQKVEHMNETKIAVQETKIALLEQSLTRVTEENQENSATPARLAVAEERIDRLSKIIYFACGAIAIEGLAFVIALIAAAASGDASNAPK